CTSRTTFSDSVLLKIVILGRARYGYWAAAQLDTIAAANRAAINRANRTRSFESAASPTINEIIASAAAKSPRLLLRRVAARPCAYRLARINTSTAKAPEVDPAARARWRNAWRSSGFGASTAR